MLPVPADLPYPPIPGLTDMQCAFVHEVLANPRGLRAAAIRAGYSKVSAHVTASRLMRNPLVAQALLDGTRVQLAAHSAEALGVKVQLMRSAKSELVRDKAAGDILERAGLTGQATGAGGASLTINIDLS